MYPSSLPTGFLTHKTHTQTHENPYPERGCGFLVGVGVGGPEIPQGYPCQSLPEVSKGMTITCEGHT